MLRKNKEGALEMSVGTIVIIVIAMSMLILGLILVRNIFTGSIYNVKELNDKVRSEIQKLFAEEGRAVVYLAEGKADIKQGNDWGVAFAFKNLERGTTDSAQFTYEVVAADISATCSGLTKQEAQSWIEARRTGSVTLPPGESTYYIVRFQIPEDAPLCIVPYDIIIKKDGEDYTTAFFDVVVE
jgi:hypothetical protein